MLPSIASHLRFLTSNAVSTALHHPVPTAVSITCGLLAYYYLKVVSVPELVSKPTSAWTKFLRSHVPLISQKYWCSVWCYEARVQTLAASLLSAAAPALQYHREILPLWDGGQICLDWIVNPMRGDELVADGCPSCSNGLSSAPTGLHDKESCNGVLPASQGGVLSPGGGTLSHGGSGASPEGGSSTPGWDGGLPEGGVLSPGGGSSAPEGGVLSPEGGILSPGGGEGSHERDETTDSGSNKQESSPSPDSSHPSSSAQLPEGSPTTEGTSVEESTLSPTDTKFPITETPLLIILPGLTGSSDSEYVKDFVGAGHAAGYKCVIMNNRGKGGIPLKTPRTYCAANCDDFAAAVEHIVERYHRERAAVLRQKQARQGHTEVYSRPDPMIVVVGISLGGMILCHYLCERSAVAKQRLTAAVGVSVPYNVFIGTDNLERPLLNYLLNNHLARCLSRSVEDLAPMLASSDVWNYEEVVKSSTIREFDSRFTAVQFGFPDVNAYYEKACLHDKMHSVCVPYLGLSSEDDPFQPRAGLPLDTARASDHVALCVTSHGGHIGFLEGVRAGSWGARLLLQLLTAVRMHPHLLQE